LGCDIHAEACIGYVDGIHGEKQTLMRLDEEIGSNPELGCEVDDACIIRPNWVLRELMVRP
jgi:hypothetical protein